MDTKEFDIAAHLASLSDEQLIAATKEAQDNLAEAAREQPDSERHQECFAGLFIYASEMQARGLKIVTVH
jgi:hypothetical protein